MAEKWNWPWWLLALFTVYVAIHGAVVGNRVCNEIGVADDGRVTIDEIAGYFTTMLIADIFFDPVGWGWMWAGFGLFRLMDMHKPFPVWAFDGPEYMDRVRASQEAGVIRRGPSVLRKSRGAWIMLDDIVAGMIAGVFMVVFSSTAERGWAALSIYITFSLLFRVEMWIDMRPAQRPNLIRAMIKPPPDW